MSADKRAEADSAHNMTMGDSAPDLSWWCLDGKAFVQAPTESLALGRLLDYEVIEPDAEVGSYVEIPALVPVDSVPAPGDWRVIDLEHKRFPPADKPDPVLVLPWYGQGLSYEAWRDIDYINMPTGEPEAWGVVVWPEVGQALGPFEIRENKDTAGRSYGRKDHLGAKKIGNAWVVWTVGANGHGLRVTLGSQFAANTLVDRLRDWFAGRQRFDITSFLEDEY